MVLSDEAVPVDEDTAAERLFDFLKKNGAEDKFFQIRQMFNVPFDLGDIIEQTKPFFLEEFNEFSRISNQDGMLILNGQNFIHFSSLVRGRLEKARMQKRWGSIPNEFKRIENNCTYHPSRSCRLLNFHVALLVFLNEQASDLEDKDSSWHTGVSPLPVSFSSDIESKDEVGGSDQKLDKAEEEILLHGLDVAVFKAKTIPEESDVEIEISKNSMTLQVVPSFKFSGKEYILLNDIQKVMNLREDYCLAIIAESCEEAMNFIDFEDDVLQLLDTEFDKENFTKAEDAFALCLQSARMIEPSLPTEAEFAAIQENLNISKMGKDQPVLPCAEEDITPQGSMYLWKEDQVIEEECTRIVVDDEDGFLKRHSRVKAGRKERDSALGHFISRIPADIFFIYHQKYSEDSIAIMTMKVLSKHLGCSKISHAADKIMFLEKKEALRIFGAAPGFVMSRAAYFLCYAAYAMADPNLNLKLLQGYQRQKLLKYRGNLPEEDEKTRREKKKRRMSL